MSLRDEFVQLNADFQALVASKVQGLEVQKNEALMTIQDNQSKAQNEINLQAKDLGAQVTSASQALLDHKLQPIVMSAPPSKAPLFIGGLILAYFYFHKRRS